MEKLSLNETLDLAKKVEKWDRLRSNLYYGKVRELGISIEAITDRTSESRIDPVCDIVYGYEIIVNDTKTMLTLAYYKSYELGRLYGKIESSCELREYELRKKQVEKPIEQDEKEALKDALSIARELISKT